MYWFNSFHKSDAFWCAKLFNDLLSMCVLTSESKVSESKLSSNDRSGIQLSYDVQLVAIGETCAEASVWLQSLPIFEHQVSHFPNLVTWSSVNLTYVWLFTPDIQHPQSHLNSWAQMKQERWFYQTVGLVTALVCCDQRYGVVKSGKFHPCWHLLPTIHERVVFLNKGTWKQNSMRCIEDRIGKTQAFLTATKPPRTECRVWNEEHRNLLKATSRTLHSWVWFIVDFRYHEPDHLVVHPE